jgi:hypothetical protein
MTDLVEHEGSFDCGWWPPGQGEPGTDWDFEPARLGLHYEASDKVITVHVMTPQGARALAAVPVVALFRVIAEDAALDERRKDSRP